MFAPRGAATHAAPGVGRAGWGCTVPTLPVLNAAAASALPPASLLTSQPVPPRMHGREESPSPPQALLSTPPSCSPPSQGKAKMYQTFGLEGQWWAPRLLLGHLCPSVLLLTGVGGAVPDSDGGWFDPSNALGPSTVRTDGSLEVLVLQLRSGAPPLPQEPPLLPSPLGSHGH